MHILFTGGGTLGSVTPLLAVAEVLLDRDPEARFSWIGTRKGPERRLLEEAGWAYRVIPSGKLRRYFSLRNIVDPFFIFAGFLTAVVFLWSDRPGVIVTAGGFVAVPVVWAAGLLRIPVHVHQQDIRPGLANRLSLPFARTVSVAFERSLEDFSSHAPVWTGNPVRRQVREGEKGIGMRRFGLEDGLPVVLVLGGGTGAVKLNTLIRKAAEGIMKSAQIFHVTGRGKDANHDGLHMRYHAVEFLTKDMCHAYAVADLVITRAGMGTLTELAALGKPTVIVPMSDSHQEDNADFFAREVGVPVYDEQSLTAEEMAKKIRALLEDDVRRAGIGEDMRRLTRQDAAERVATLITNPS